MNEVAAILDDIQSILEKKNQDYGDSFHDTFAEFGIISSVIRLNDKMKRLKTLIKNSSKPNYESIEDTLKDIIGYAVLTLKELNFKNSKI
jgi:hypothetical protein